MKIKIDSILTLTHICSNEMATEKIFKKEILRHGEAVGLGMICEILLTKINRGNNNVIIKKVEKIF